MLMRLFICTILAFVSTCLCLLQAQNNYLKNIPRSAIDSANTAIKLNMLTNEEKDVFLYTNLVRIRPQLFLKEIALPFIEANNLNGTHANTLKSDLKKQKPVGLLYPDKGLTDCARVHAESTGKKGTTGHAGFTDRFKKYAPDLMNQKWGENCSYGDDNNIGLNAVMQLLIDEGNSDYGHRKNILEPIYTFLGVSIQPHKVYEYTCVQDFGRR